MCRRLHIYTRAFRVVAGFRVFLTFHTEKEKNKYI
nr:MAG TPA: hypothetical protein [Caudoviricetes sp.]